MKKVVSARVTEGTLEFLERYFRNRTCGAEYLLESFPNLFAKEMAGIKEKLNERELKLIIDVFNGLLPTPILAGHHLLASVEDGIRLDNLDMKWEIDAQVLLDKIEALSPAQRAILEIWAIGYWQHDPLPDLEEYAA